MVGFKIRIYNYLKLKMENENLIVESKSNNEVTEYPEIYSSKAIFGFSFGFSTIFGAILLSQNLLEIKKSKDALIVLFITTTYLILQIYLSSYITFGGSVFGLATNFIGGKLLIHYFFDPHFPEEYRYEKKSITKPVIFSIIFILIVFFVLFQMDM